MSSCELISLERGKAIIDKQLDKLYVILDNLAQAKSSTDKGVAIGNREFMETYTIIYDMCVQKENNFNESLYKEYQAIFSNYLHKRAYPTIQDKRQSDLLVELQKRWTNQKLMMRWMERFFQYLDRFHVPHNGLPSLNKIGLETFRTCIIDSQKSHIIDAFMRELSKDRNGMEANRGSMRTVAVILVTLETVLGIEGQKLYNEFESRLISESEAFYQQKAMEWVEKCSCPEYLSNVEQLLQEERTRLEAILYGKVNQVQTLEKILSGFNKQLIESYKTVILNKSTGFLNMIEHEKTNSILQVYELFKRLDDKFEGLHQAFKNYLVKKGSEIINQKKLKLESTDEKDREKESSQSRDPEFVKALMEFYDKYDHMVGTCFSGDIYFDRAFKEAMEEFLNVQMKPSISHFLADFLDSLLDKHGSKNVRYGQEEIDKFLDKSMDLFASLKDKDIFLGIYGANFSRRLIYNTVANDENEQAVIAKLKICCGTEFTRRIEGMLQDIQITSEDQRNFKEFVKEKYPLFPDSIDFNIKVLTKTNWPDFETDKGVQLPREIDNLTKTFTKYYTERFQRKTLEWVYSASDIELAAQLGTQRNLIGLNFYQYLILNLFEHNDEITVEVIITRTGLDEDTVRRNVAPMCLHRDSAKNLIIKQSEGKTISKSDVLALNFKFNPKLRKFNVPPPKRQEDTMKIENKIHEERHMAVEAAIVRVMKSRKSLNMNDIVEDVCRILRQFSPDIKFIKKKIEDLVEKEYLKRDNDDRKLFHYLA